MANHQTYLHDERILQALLRLTRGVERGSTENPGAVELPLDSEPAHEEIDDKGWDVLVRSRPPRS